MGSITVSVASDAERLSFVRSRLLELLRQRRYAAGIEGCAVPLAYEEAFGSTIKADLGSGFPPGDKRAKLRALFDMDGVSAVTENTALTFSLHGAPGAGEFEVIGFLSGRTQIDSFTSSSSACNVQ